MMVTTQEVLEHLNNHLTVGDLDALDTPDLTRLRNVLQHWANQAEKRLLERRPVSPANPIDVDPWWLVAPAGGTHD